MLQLVPNTPLAKDKPLYVGIARNDEEVRAAQRLRYRVFVEELGARLPAREPGIDRDYYDAFCDQLVVCDEENGRVIGAYRLLPPEAARRAGSYYSETEFNIDRLRHLRPRTVEVGRACIDADYRTGGTIALLWSGIIRYMLSHGYEYLIGCASIGMADGRRAAAGIFSGLDNHMAPLEYRAFPICPLPLERIVPRLDAEVPALMKGYLRAGAWVCGQPAWDPDFNTADLMMLLPMSRISPRYARHFVARQEPLGR